MNHAEKCPVCIGKGKLKRIKKLTHGSEEVTHAGSKTCHGCNGKGWITVEDQGKMFGEPMPGDPPVYIPYYPSWPDPNPNEPYWDYQQPGTMWTYTCKREDLT